MATHSSILAWRIPETEEPGRLQSMGSDRVRHDLGIKQQQFNPRIFGCPLQADCCFLPLPRWTAYESVLMSVLRGTSHLPLSSWRGGSLRTETLVGTKVLSACDTRTVQDDHVVSPDCFFFSFLFYVLSYESMIKHLQETWKIQVTYSSTIYYNFFKQIIFLVGVLISKSQN